MKEEEFDTDYKGEIICPYCGFKFGDSWEYNDLGGHIIHCEDCNKEFQLEVDFETTYSTYKKEDKI